MSDRHFYKHVVTGIVTELNDTTAAVFGDHLERVTKSEAENLPQVGGDVVESVPEQRASRNSKSKSVADKDTTDEEAN